MFFIGRCRVGYLYPILFFARNFNVLGLNQDRADVIIPACEIYMSVMKWAGIKNMYVPSVGMVDGIIQTLIDKNYVKSH